MGLKGARHPTRTGKIVLRGAHARHEHMTETSCWETKKRARVADKGWALFFRTELNKTTRSIKEIAPTAKPLDQEGGEHENSGFSLTTKQGKGMWRKSEKTKTYSIGEEHSSVVPTAKLHRNFPERNGW